MARDAGGVCLPALADTGSFGAICCSTHPEPGLNLNRSTSLRTSLLAHFGCQLARRYLDLLALGQPSLSRLEAKLQVTTHDHDQIREEAATDWDVWAVAAGADVPTLLEAKALWWLDMWARWGRLGGFDVQALAMAVARGSEEDSVGWLLPAVRDLLVDSMKAAEQAGWDMQDA